MKILIPVQLVPDRVEEIVIRQDGTGFEREDIAWILNEFDDHAIEEGILLKEKYDAEVVVSAAGGELSDEALYMAAAKGADRLMRVDVDFSTQEINNHALARAFAPIVEEENPDLILTGVSNHDGYDGAMGALLAGYLDLPYIGYISAVELEGSCVRVLKDYPGGVKVRLEADVPLVLGISSSQDLPRYVPVSRVRQAMKSSSIEEKEAAIDLSGGMAVASMYEPEAGNRAEMLTGSLKDIADRVAEIARSQGLV